MQTINELNHQVTQLKNANDQLTGECQQLRHQHASKSPTTVQTKSSPMTLGM